jgi:hypothetical protein
MICKICNSNTKQVFTSKILKKYDVKYFKCDNCGYLFTEEPFWLEEAYSRSINLSDTGLLDRNIYFSKILAIIIFFCFNKKEPFLDYAGGYGVFTRLMRDIGFDFYWDDPYTNNLFANGFEKNVSMKPRFELVTAFEVFEHLVNPKDELKKMLLHSDTVIFSTELMKQEIPDPKDWWYYGFNHGQHISFYTKRTLTILAKQFNLKYYSVRGLHIITPKTFNNYLLVLLKILGSFGLLQIIKLGLKSKTFLDHLILKSSKNQ